MRLLIALVSVCLLVSCSSGSSSHKSNNNQNREIEVNEPELYSLGGTARGLSGTLVLQLGDETLSLSPDSLPEDGSFAFQSKFVAGSRYNVSILSLPPQQLCEIQHSRDFILHDRDDLHVHCATMVEVDIQLDVPSTYELSDLRLLSNYQAKGGTGEQPLDDANTRLLVFDNSFVSLRNQDGKLIYLSFIDDASQGSFKLNALTTAFAMLLLDPTVANALQERDLTVAELIDGLQEDVFIGVDEDKLNNLVGEIALLAESRKDLLTESTSLIADLQQVLDLLIAYLETLPLTTEAEIASVATAVGGSVELADAGVKFEYLRAAFNEDVQISVINQRQRYVTLFTDTLGQILLAPDQQYDATLEGGIAADSSVEFFVSGLGKSGDLPVSREQGYLGAARMSGLQQRFLPSLNLMLGLSQPGEFALADCLSDEDINSLLTALNTTTLNQAFIDNDLAKAFLLLNHLARQKFVKTEKDKSALISLFACEKLGVGLLFDDQKSIAKDNISGILRGLQTVFDPAQGLEGLFGAATASELNSAIELSARSAQWQLSNFLQLTISADPNHAVYPEQQISFSGTCVDPNTDLASECTIVWDFGDAESGEGVQLEHSYLAAGSYTVSATATDNDGVSSTQSLQLEVLPFDPKLEIYVDSVAIASGELACVFGAVPLGESRSCDIELRNTGKGELLFASASGSQGDYSWSIAQNPVAPESNTMMTVQFSPTSVGPPGYEHLNLASNDPALASFFIGVQGQGQATQLPSTVEWQVETTTENGEFWVVRQIVNEVQQGDSWYLDVQLFADMESSYPQLRLLFAYDRSNPEQRYQLDDTAASECLGFFALGADVNTSYCTRSSGVFAGAPASGFIDISGLDEGQMMLTFEFSALPLSCPGPDADCQQISVTGTVSTTQP